MSSWLMECWTGGGYRPAVASIRSRRGASRIRYLGTSIVTFTLTGIMSSHFVCVSGVSYERLTLGPFLARMRCTGSSEFELQTVRQIPEHIEDAFGSSVTEME